MKLKSSNIDMLHGPLTKKLLLFTLPIALSSMLQQLFSAADTAVVGYFGNQNALAAVGTNTEIVALIVTVSSGLSIGANVLVAKFIGGGNQGDLSRVITNSLLLAILIGFFGLALGQVIASPLLRFIHAPETILADASLYLRIYLLGYPFLLLYDFGSAILRARGDSRYPFMALVFSGLVNVGLNLFFVVVFRMGVAGVSIATDLSNMLAAFIVLKRLFKENEISHKNKQPLFSSQISLEILKVGLPSAIQGAVFCFANIFVQASVNSFGATAIAGSTVAMNFEYFTYYIITAFGQTATTFTGQNHAAGQRDRCKKILWQCLLLSTILSSIPIYSILIFRSFFAGLFSPDQAVIECAITRIMCILAFEPICNLYEIPAGALRGSGHALYPAISTMVGTCAFRILWICTVFPAYHRLPVLYHAFPLSWCVTILLVNLGFFWIGAQEKTR